jgi:hypothetical protein
MGFSLRAFTAALLCSVAAASASAATITFNALPGGNGTPLTTYDEAGFTVANSAGQFFGGTLFGNPTPSIFAGPQFGPATNAITITRTGGGAFTLDEFDIASNNGASEYTILGTLAGATVLNLVGTQPQISPFGFVQFNVGSALLDTVTLTFTARGTSMNIDNIDVTPGQVQVPEPMSAALLGAGLLGLGLMRRRAAV